MFPAHAGMIPAVTATPVSVTDVPRTRGDDPLEEKCRKHDT